MRRRRPVRDLRARLREALRRTVLRVFEARLLGEASAVAFYALLALFPAVAALVWMCGLLADPAAAAARLRDGASGAPRRRRRGHPRTARRPRRPAERHIGLRHRSGHAHRRALGGTAAAAQLSGALNAAYGERESQGPLRLYAAALLWDKV